MEITEVKRAIQSLDSLKIGQIADELRFQFWFNYEQTMEFFEAHGADRDDIEAIFYEIDATGSID